MLLKPSSRGRGTQPTGPVLVNRASPLSVGLRRWWQPTLHAGWRRDYGSDQVVVSEQATPLLRGNAVGGVGAYCTANAGILIPKLTGVTSGSTFTLRLVCTPMTWPGGFTAWIDDNFRDFATFMDTSGAVSFGGSVWQGLLPPLTIGKRWDLVLAADANILAGRPTVYVNGVNMGAGGNADWSRDDAYLGFNFSGGGVGADCIYETLQVWNRCLRDQDVWQLYDPATRWDLYWVPSARTFFDIGGGVVVPAFDWYQSPPGPDRTPPSVVGYQTQ